MKKSFNIYSHSKAIKAIEGGCKDSICENYWNHSDIKEGRIKYPDNLWIKYKVTIIIEKI